MNCYGENGDRRTSCRAPVSLSFTNASIVPVVIGRLEFFFIAARRLGRTHLEAITRARAVETVTNANRDDRFGWVAGDDSSNSGFYTGGSGIGYSLLRMAKPNLLPCVLVLQ